MSSIHEWLLDKVHIPPPFHSEDPNPLPRSVLLDPQGFISNRTTTTAAANALTKQGKPIHVTFWVANAPRAPFFTVHIPEAAWRFAIGDTPMILNTEEDIVLLRVLICPPGCNFYPSYNNYFVYLAGTKHNWSSLIPTPLVFLFHSDSDAALLRCCKRYLIALLCRSFDDGHEFALHLYNSKSKSWSSTPMHLDSPERAYKYSSKVIAIGGERGSVGWVDLWRGILVCDLLKDNDCLCYIPLPSVVHRPVRGPPLLVQDINVFIKEYIKFFDMCLYVGSNSVTKGWVAATWRREVSCTEWKEDCMFKVSDDMAFHNLQEDERREPTLKGLYSGFPALSLHDDDVVYLMDKSDLVDKKASTIVVDMSNQTLKGVADFGSGRPLGYIFVYFQSGRPLG